MSKPALETTVSFTDHEDGCTSVDMTITCEGKTYKVPVPFNLVDKYGYTGFIGEVLGAARNQEAYLAVGKVLGNLIPCSCHDGRRN